MPRLTPNFPAHASRDVWQDGWLSPRRSLFRCTQPGAAAHDRTPALPRSTRDGGAGGRGDGLGADQGGALPRRAALCDEGGARAGLWAAPAPRAAVRPPRAGPDPAARARGRGGASAEGDAEAGMPRAALRVGRAPARPAPRSRKKGTPSARGRLRGGCSPAWASGAGGAGEAAGAAMDAGRRGVVGRSRPLLPSDRAIAAWHTGGGDAA